MFVVLKDGLFVKVILWDFYESLEFVFDFFVNKSNVLEFDKINLEYVNVFVNFYYWMEDVEVL